MSSTDYVSVSVSTNPVGLTAPGFGTLMHLSYCASSLFAGARSKSYSSLAGVQSDFPNATGPEQLAATVWFSQSPVPERMVIGRGTNKPTKTVNISAINPTTNPSFTYLINVTGDGFASVQVTFTSDANPTDAEWAAGMLAALNGVAGKNYTVTGAASPITATGNTPGAWFAFEIVDVLHMTQTETTADPGVGADITAIRAENDDWYCLNTAFNSKAYGIAAAVAIEAITTSPKIYVVATADTSIILTAKTGTNDLMDQAQTNAYKRTSVHYHPRPAAFYDAGLAGANLTFQPGQETWALREVAGPGTFPLQDAHRTNITARNGNSYELVFGLGTSFNGMMANGGFIDTKRAIDFVVAFMSRDVFIALRPAGGKLPDTDQGFVALKTVVSGFLHRVSGGVNPIVDEATIVVTFTLRKDQPNQDVNSRTYNGIRWSATVQGAVHKVPVVGTIGGA